MRLTKPLRQGMIRRFVEKRRLRFPPVTDTETGELGVGGYTRATNPAPKTREAIVSTGKMRLECAARKIGCRTELVQCARVDWGIQLLRVLALGEGVNRSGIVDNRD